MPFEARLRNLGLLEQLKLRAEFDGLQDVHTSAWFTFISGTRWFGVWLDWIVVVYLACVVLSFLVLGSQGTVYLSSLVHFFAW